MTYGAFGYLSIDWAQTKRYCVRHTSDQSSPHILKCQTFAIFLEFPIIRNPGPNKTAKSTQSHRHSSTNAYRCATRKNRDCDSRIYTGTGYGAADTASNCAFYRIFTRNICINIPNSGTNHRTKEREEESAGGVTVIHRVVAAICEHVMAKHPLTSTEISVGVNEPAVGEVIVPALEIVKARFAVIIVTTVAQWVDVPDEGRIRGLFAVSTMHGVVTPRAVVVGGDERTGGIQKGNDITLRIEDVVVEGRGHSVLRDTANIGYLKTI